MSAEAFTHNVFLSHNQADKPRVRRLAERLRAVGFNFGRRTSEFALLNAVRLAVRPMPVAASSRFCCRGRSLKQLGTRQTAFGCAI
jgi:hypothetical protein